MQLPLFAKDTILMEECPGLQGGSTAPCSWLGQVAALQGKIHSDLKIVSFHVDLAATFTLCLGWEVHLPGHGGCVHGSWAVPRLDPSSSELVTCWFKHVSLGSHDETSRFFSSAAERLCTPKVRLFRKFR